MARPEDIFKPLTSSQALFNTRFKYFGDCVKVTCFSKPVFNPYQCEPRKRKIRFGYSQDVTNESRTDSIKRAKDKVFEICFANDFQYFVTLTLDESKISRTDKDEIICALNKWLKNRVRSSGLKYILVPEYHADGKAVHFHGLMSGNLKMKDSGTVCVRGYEKPMKIETAQRLGLDSRTIYNLEQWQYGFSTAITLDAEKERTALYITKYITKENGKITGRFYYSGGYGLLRQVPTEYRNYPYSEFEAPETTVIPNCLAVKYKML